MTRTPTPLEMSEQQALVRIAMLASHILRVLRLPERGRYSSERVLDGRRPYDDTDALAADVCASLKRHGEQFDNDEQLRSYLDEDKVTYTEQSLPLALRQLELIGRIRRIRVDQFDPDWALPGVHVPPRIRTG